MLNGGFHDKTCVALLHITRLTEHDATDRDFSFLLILLLTYQVDGEDYQWRIHKLTLPPA